jgi:hypothetical protein
VRLSLGESVYDPTDPMGKCYFNILATFAGIPTAAIASPLRSSRREAESCSRPIDRASSEQRPRYRITPSTL